MIIYDLEIQNAIRGKGESPIEGVKYCGGWSDHANMGIACIGVHDYIEDRSFVLAHNQIEDFVKLIEKRELVIGFNNTSFDDPLLEANLGDLYSKTGWAVVFRSYDLRNEIVAAANAIKLFSGGARWAKGYSLDEFCKANGIEGKNGCGRDAPILFQTGRIKELHEYCLNDIRCTKRLVDIVIATGELTCPVTKTRLKVRRPEIASKC